MEALPDAAQRKDVIRMSLGGVVPMSRDVWKGPLRDQTTSPAECNRRSGNSPCLPATEFDQDVPEGEFPMYRDTAQVPRRGQTVF
jgi:hypothetical protein